MRTMKLVLMTAVVSAATLAGCAGAPLEAGELTVRHTLGDSLVTFTVDDAPAGMTYDDLLIISNNEPWSFGPRMDALARQYSVEGKDEKLDEIARGDVIKLPAAGSAEIELRDRRDGESLQEFLVMVRDLTAPLTPDLLSPTPGANGVSRQAVFRWAQSSDVSGVQYELEYWVTTAAASAPEDKITQIQGTSYAVPKSAELRPGTTYEWHVRALDGAGNVGDWSESQEFETTL